MVSLVSWLQGQRSEDKIIMAAYVKAWMLKSQSFTLVTSGDLMYSMPTGS